MLCPSGWNLQSFCKGSKKSIYLQRKRNVKMKKTMISQMGPVTSCSWEHSGDNENKRDEKILNRWQAHSKIWTKAQPNKRRKESCIEDAQDDSWSLCLSFRFHNQIIKHMTCPFYKLENRALGRLSNMPRSHSKQTYQMKLSSLALLLPKPLSTHRCFSKTKA